MIFKLCYDKTLKNFFASRNNHSVMNNEIKPDIQIKDIHLSGITTRKFSLSAELDIINPFPVGGSVKSVIFEIFFEKSTGESVYLGRGRKDGIKIEKSGTTAVSVPVEIENISAVSALITALTDRIEIIIKGKADFDLKITSLSIPFERREKINSLTDLL
ncbi:LEA type 2 family protein [Methanoplanus endosymbiosus]|uniref:LEA type 2 family protein n=1 Tax=Methanoplanus endosymbiosus TaxID=33865 RepID=A0A9E7PJU1_9EURY|nr:LEA type 2 family protein [Methanoplanus endosymbiosus]UUX91283.1 LEA type 2 family protein [Methanoplanus endosymbiosus]